MGRRATPARGYAWAASCALFALLLSGCAASTTPHVADRLSGSLPRATPTLRPSYTALVPPPAVSAAAYLVVNPQTGTVYLAHDAQAELPMASTTKIMTALVALTFGKPDQLITVGPDATALDNTDASLAHLRLGDALTLHDLLYALLLPSGDDAAVAIAEGVAGSQTRFVGLMNLEAALLGLTHTRYANVHGLDAPGHYTTADDLATLARSVMRNPTFARVVATVTYSLAASADHRDYTWTTTNELLSSHHYPGATGVKTGFTGNAGDCLVFSATRPSGDILGVELGEPSDDARFNDATALLNWGFSVEYAAELAEAHASS